MKRDDENDRPGLMINFTILFHPIIDLPLIDASGVDAIRRASGSKTESESYANKMLGKIKRDVRS